MALSRISGITNRIGCIDIRIGRLIFVFLLGGRFEKSLETAETAEVLAEKQRGCLRSMSGVLGVVFLGVSVLKKPIKLANAKNV